MPKPTPKKITNSPVDPITIQTSSSNSSAPKAHLVKSNTTVESTDNQVVMDKISAMLSQGRATEAAGYLEAHYSQLSLADINRVKGLFMKRLRENMAGSNSGIAADLALIIARLFDDVDDWNIAAHLLAKQANWEQAITALRRSAILENRPPQLHKKHGSLVKFASHLRAQYEAVNDYISTKQLYQSLYDEHPGYARFQYELALSHLRLDDLDSAKPLLASLQYDPDLGDIAKQSLARVAQREENIKAAKTNTIAKANSALPEKNDVVVPLQRVGNSFIVSSQINGRSINLLLDTGASITAMSSDLINHFGLRPLNKSIQLSTANGVTQARLFTADTMQLGRLKLSNFLIAEIDMGDNSAIQGLLGTDVLNQISNYSYLIDNSQNSLIFRPRK